MAPNIRIQDIADILIMTFLLYQLYTWFRGTRAIQVLLGLGVVTLIYFATRFLGLYMTSWVLQELGTVLIILIIVVFQAEIRQALYRFSLLRHMLDSNQENQQGQFQEIAETIFSMASRRTGTLLVFQRNEPLNELVSNGVQLDCEISPQMLESIFYDGAPLHDGAALIKDGRIALASCHLPLSISPDIPQSLGTRHRAALGLSERCDAVIVVVSEERGEVSLVTAGKLRLMESTPELIAALDELFHSDKPAPSISIREKIFANLLPKVALLLCVCVFWALITTRQGQITTVTAPVILHGIPEGLILLKTAPEEVNVQLKSLSSLSPPPSKLDLTAELDASKTKEGQTSIRVNSSDISLPSGLAITGISPSSIRITTEKKLRKSVPVKAALKGKLPPGLSSMQVVCEPDMVVIEGPSSQVAAIESVLTDDIDATRLKKGNVYLKNIRPLQKQVSLLKETPVTIRLVTRGKRR
ncbi:MAG TPA: TIGR00159 family protein [Geobacter sp.]|nr:TIGR00159 family protein [Geobacter sp.]HCE68692.1 TIGR00159 family protein [Geobacter sp.]